jgi:hypothetical protein
MGFFQFA